MIKYPSITHRPYITKHFYDGAKSEAKKKSAKDAYENSQLKAYNEFVKAYFAKHKTASTKGSFKEAA
jgi:hypothetical protein